MGRGLLPLWFLTFAYAYAAVIARAGYLGADFRIYYRATHLWLAGGDPWSAVVSIFSPAHFGAPPLSLLPVAPFMLLTEDQSAIVFVAICALSGFYVVRRLRMGPAWLLFPPLVFGVVSGNPSIPLLALLLAGTSWASALAVSLKVYAIVPLIAQRRWLDVVVVVGLLAAFVVASPGIWIDYAQRFGEIGARLSAESHGGYGALSWPPLVPPTVLALAVIARYDLPAAGWLAVPALWPGSEFHWVTFAMPVMTPWLGAMLAIYWPGLAAVVTWPYAIMLWWRARRANRLETSASQG
jgi:hypothetical protein